MRLGKRDETSVGILGIGRWCFIVVALRPKVMRQRFQLSIVGNMPAVAGFEIISKAGYAGFFATTQIR